jgi:phage FluMu protein Com
MAGEIMLIDARCNHCHKFLCQISHDLIGVVRLMCPRCQKENDVSLATVIKEVEHVKFNPELQPAKPTWS